MGGEITRVEDQEELEKNIGPCAHELTAAVLVHIRPVQDLKSY